MPGWTGGSVRFFARSIPGQTGDFVRDRAYRAKYAVTNVGKQAGHKI